MIPLKDNHDVASFLVTKHSWKGKYKRVFSIGTQGITTYNPDKLEVTNRWAYSDIITLTCTRHSNSATHHDFTLVMRKDKKVDTMKFSSEHKYLIMTEAFKYRQLFAEKPKELLRYQAYKHHWSDTRLPVVLEVTPCSLDQLDPATHTVLAHYHYCDIEGIIPLYDYPGGFVVACGGFSRLHLFSAPNFTDIRNKILENAINTLGLSIKVLTTTITMEDFQNQRFGKYSGDQHQTSISEFVVHKVSSARHMEPPRRILCLSDTCILERDPQTYSVCCLRPLADVWALVRHPTNPQMFAVEYLNGHVRTYLATERDALLASLMDGVRSAGNRDVHVKMQATPRGKRFGPLHLPVDEETESNHLRLFQNPGLLSRAEVIERFNANVAYSGLLYSVNQDRLFAENKEKLIAQALLALMQTERNSGSNMPLSELEAQFHALRRLSASKVGFAAFTTLPGLREWVGSAVVAALRRGDAASSHAALDALGALLQPMHADPDLRQEQLNKCSMLANKPFLNGLLDMWTEHVTQGSGALVVAAMLDFLTFALCVPYSETTEGKHFDQLLEMVAGRGRSLFMLFEHPSMAIVKGAGLVMRALVEEGASGGRMQALALAEAALPRHLLAALYGTATGTRLAQRQLSRHLVTLWVTGHPPAIALLKRILPAGLLSFLESEEKVPAAALAAERVAERDNLAIASEASAASRKTPQWLAIDRQLKYVEKHLEHYTQLALQHWALHTGMTMERKEKLRERPIVLRKRRENIKSESNWPYFYYQFSNDHALPNLIWNHKTREELRNALENELRAFTSERELAGDVLTAWNHTELELVYHCLQEEVKIGDYYLRILLQSEDSPYCPIRKSYEFFNELYHRFLLTPKVEMKCMCLQAMAVVYARYYEDIGPFPDTKFIVQMLDRTTDRMERDRLVIFLNKLILHRRNVRELLEWNGVRILVELMTLAHLHTSRATVPAQSNVLEAAPSVAGQQADKEWYYHVENGGSVNRVGPVSCKELGELLKAQKITSRTKCWANSMDGWRVMHAIPQLKWTLLARGSPVLNESELATLILNLLITCCQYFPSRDEDNAIIRPLPKVKRLLSEPVLLAHVVQILLTFDPVLVEKVATLLYEVMQDNSEVSKLYMTGVFYFILMYTGSNVLPIARFLQLTHMKQAFRPDESTSSDIMQRSILGQLLPEAMVCYLHNHGAEKFAQIFLGEYDTPEAIWNSEMRRMLIVKVSAHIGEFTPRLRAHVAARYPYLGMPVVRYPQLQHELFCNVFYLRHLSDTTRFPDWPIPEPVRLLKDVLEAWRAEVEKKPPAMTVEEAYGALGLAPGRHHEEARVRKAYYKLAQQYHPDKNPEGRDRFESVNQAYEFLCSRSVWSCDGPNPNNIVLVLRTQTILFNRYSEELSAYKYAGYPQLLRTVSAQAESETLFQESGGALLAAACALAHATVHSSPLNAEELQREGGLQVLHDAFTRCVSVLSASSKPSDLAAEVCMHCCRCFAVAAQFSACRDVMAAIPQLLTDIVRILHFSQLGELCCAAAEACGALAAHSEARVALVRAHALHVLLASALHYDYTLDEGGVEKEAQNNKQEVSNQLAKLSIVACGKLGGYVGHESETPADANIRRALETLLTPYLYAKLADDSPEELLKILNSNWRNPYLVWDNSTRAELSEFLETGKGSALTSEEDILTQDFHYSAHEGHLLVGNVFVQIYNEQPTFSIENPKGFTLDLLQFLNERVQEVPSEELTSEMEMVLTALANVIVENPGVEIQCIGQFGLIFGLLSSGHAGVTRATLAVVRAATRSGECVEDVAASAVLGHLLALLGAARLQHHADALLALAALLTNTRIVREALQKGCVIYLLDLFCNSRIPETRESAAELLARMMADKLHGPKVRLSMSRHLPAVFGEAMRESGGSAAGGGAAAAHMFDSSHQHPELVWDDAARQTVCTNVAALTKQHYAVQQRDANTIWHEPETTSPDAGGWAPPGEVVVGGVYLRLFIASPHWTVRSPKQFLAELLDETLTNLTKDKGESERTALCARALNALLAARPALAEHAARLGHVPRLARLLPACPVHAVPLLRSLADSQLCVTALAQTDCIQGLKEAMKSCTSTVGTACEALSRMFCSPANTDQLVNQALESDMVGHLLRLLEEVAEGQTRAQIVAALKAMARSAAHGERVRAALARSPVWSRYAAQRHDLFIADGPAPGRLGPAAPAAAGYLAAPPANITLQPPPVD